MWCRIPDRNIETSWRTTKQYFEFQLSLFAVSEDEKEAAMLFEEADMPLEKLLERYTASGQQLGKLRQGSKIQSPAIRAKKESATSSEAEDRTNNGGGDAKLNLAGELLVNGTDEKVKDSEIKPADSGGVVDNQTDVLDTKNVRKSEVTASKEAESSDCNGCSQSTQGAGRSSSAVSSTTSTEGLGPGSAGGSSSKSPVSGVVWRNLVHTWSCKAGIEA